MKFENLDFWKAEAESRKYAIKQLPGYEQFDALDGDVVVGHWHGDGNFGTITELAVDDEAAAAHANEIAIARQNKPVDPEPLPVEEEKLL